MYTQTNLKAYFYNWDIILIPLFKTFLLNYLPSRLFSYSKLWFYQPYLTQTLLLRHIQLIMAPQLLGRCLGRDTLLITFATAFYTIVHGVGLMNVTYESYHSYKQGQSDPGTCVANVARLVSAYAMVVSGAYLSFHSFLYFYIRRSSTLSPVDKFH